MIPVATPIPDVFPFRQRLSYVIRLISVLWGSIVIIGGITGYKLALHGK